jgi:hypothetical protein
MAFKQKPGRGNSPKTGHGLPSPLRQDNVEPTEKYIKGKKKYQENAAKGNVDSGLNVNPATGFATAKPYEKKFVTNTTTRGASIIGGDNKTTATASSYGQGKEVEALRKRFTSDSTATMNQRNRNAEFFNANSGGTKFENLNKRQRADLKSIGKASPTKQIGAAIVKGAKDVGAKVMKGIKALDKQANKGSR